MISLLTITLFLQSCKSSYIRDIPGTTGKEECVSKDKYNNCIDIATKYRDKLASFNEVLEQNNADFNKITAINTKYKWVWGLVGAIIGITAGTAIGIYVGVTLR